MRRSLFFVCFAGGILTVVPFSSHHKVRSQPSESHAEYPVDVAEISPFYRQDRREHEEGLPTVANPEGLATLLEKRHASRKNGAYEQVSAIDRALKADYSVKAYDHPPVWTRLRTPPVAFQRRQAQKKSIEMKQAFGPRGHPYEQVGGDIDPLYCDLSVTDVHALLSRRARCRSASKFEEADAILLELSIHGVRVCDYYLQWTANPKHEFRSTTNAAVEVASSPQDSPRLVPGPVKYIRDSLSAPFKDDRFQQRVEQLVSFRSDSLERGEFQLADNLELELFNTYNVGVSDFAYSWSVGGQFLVDSDWRPPQINASVKNHTKNSDMMFPPKLVFRDEEKDFESSVRYRQSFQSQPVMDHVYVERIKALVKERVHKREEAKYAEADAIRRELWHTYHVGVNDRLQQYSVGGVYDDNGDQCLG